MATRILTNLNYDKKTKGKVLNLIRNHMFDYQWYKPEFSDLQTARWVRGLVKTEQGFEELMAHRVGDTKGQNPAYTQDSLKAHDTMVERIKGLGLKRILEAKPVVNGNDLMSTFKQTPGRWIKVLKEHILDKQLLGEIKNKKEALEYLKDYEVDIEGNLTKK
jgi:hypothetical protein